MRLLCGSILCALLFAPAASAQGVKIVGETKYKLHALVRLKAEGIDAKAALLWRVHPSKDVQKATSPRGVLEFAAHPGVYEVELLVITNANDALQVEEARVTIEIESCGPAPPKPDPKPPGDGKLDPVAALGRIRFGNAGCTATVIGPRRPDGKWDVLTAAECLCRSSAAPRHVPRLLHGELCLVASKLDHPAIGLEKRLRFGNIFQVGVPEGQ